MVLLAGTVVWSHVRAPADPSQWDGRPGLVCEGVIDGNTFLVTGPGLGYETVHLRGVDAPAADAPFGPQAKATLAARLKPGRADAPPITLKFDTPHTRDSDGHWLAFVYLGESDCLNADLIRDGLAYADRRTPTMLDSTLDQLETQARTRGVGLWKTVHKRDMPVWRQQWLDKKKSPTGN